LEESSETTILQVDVLREDYIEGRSFPRASSKAIELSSHSPIIPRNISQDGLQTYILPEDWRYSIHCESMNGLVAMD